MTQADRDRLVTLKKAKKRVITQREAAEELGVTVRHVKRLLYALKKDGDKSIVHGLRGRSSNRKIDEKIERQAVKILSAPVYEGFGPTLAAEYLEKKHGIEASKETVRQWMMRAKLWRGEKAGVKAIHVWRPRRSRFGELVQWDTSDHDWLEGRGERLYLIAMIDDATSRLFARFVRHDSTEENPWRSTRTRRASSVPRRSGSGTSREWRKIRWKCRRRRSGGRWGNWGSRGLRRIPRKRKGGWREISRRHKIGW